MGGAFLLDVLVGVAWPSGEALPEEEGQTPRGHASSGAAADAWGPVEEDLRGLSLREGRREESTNLERERSPQNGPSLLSAWGDCASREGEVLHSPPRN